MSKQTKKKRTAFYFPGQSAAQLEAIKRRSRFSNNADVLRAALKVYDELLEITYQGCSIVVRDTNGTDYPYSPYEPFHYPGFDRPVISGRSEKDAVGASSGSVPKNFVLTDEWTARLNSIRSRSFLHSNADVLRAALSAYDELLRVLTLRDRIFIVDTAGNQHPYTPHAPVARERMQIDAPLVKVSA